MNMSRAFGVVNIRFVFPCDRQANGVRGNGFEAEIEIELN